MKMKFETEIDAGLGVVWTAYTNPENMTRCLENLVSHTHLSGEPGQPGAKSKLVFDENGKEVTLIETITERRDPDFLALTFNADHGITKVVNHFEIIDENKTRYTSWVRMSLNGFLRFIAIFIRGAIRKRTEGDMARFKLLVESEVAEAGQ